MQKVTMTKEVIRVRIQEVLSGPEDGAKQRIEMCLWGLDKIKGGIALTNELIDELGLQRFGAQHRVEQA